MIIGRLALTPRLLLQIVKPASFGQQEIPRRLRNRQKKRPKLLSSEDKKIEYNPVQAIHLMRLHSFVTFPESV